MIYKTEIKELAQDFLSLLDFKNGITDKENLFNLQIFLTDLSNMKKLSR